MSNNNAVTKFVMASSLTALVGGAAYYLYQSQNLSKVHVDCVEHMKLLVNDDKMMQVLDDLRIEFTPYYIYYYNLL